MFIKKILGLYEQVRQQLHGPGFRRITHVIATNFSFSSFPPISLRVPLFVLSYFRLILATNFQPWCLKPVWRLIMKRPTPIGRMALN